MSLPPRYAGESGESQFHFYRNVCLEFKKTIKNSKDINLLLEHMERFLNASKEVKWPHSSSDVYHKDEAEKAVQKVLIEFQRYVQSLEKNLENAETADLLLSIELVETQIDKLKVR